MTRAYLATFLAFSLAGCGLISPDIDDFLLQLPEKQFTVDTAQWGVVDPGDGQLPTVPCTTAGNECQVAATTLCNMAVVCVGLCVQSSCELRVPFSLFQGVNLGVENPEFQTVDSRARVRVNEIFFTVSENTLNVASPPLDVWVAPIYANEISHVEAQKVGSIPSVGPGEVNTRAIAFTAEGLIILETYMSDYNTAFNFIVAGEALIRPSGLIPTGKAVGLITGTLVADKF